MNYTVPACIDHATIYCQDKEVLNRIFAALGFFSKNDVHYMTTNSYFELYQPLSKEETYPFFQSKAGLHSFIFWSDDIDNCYDRLTGAGYVTAMPVSNFSRPADHGEPTGEAHFRGFYMQTQLLPIGETAVVQQMSPELIYPAKPYLHPNTVIAMDKMYLCHADAETAQKTADDMKAFCDVIKQGRPYRNCITELENGLAEDYLQEYGVKVDPTRSCCTGIRLLVEDMDKLREFVSSSGMPYSEKDGQICVDLADAANLFLIFKKA